MDLAPESSPEDRPSALVLVGFVCSSPKKLGLSGLFLVIAGLYVPLMFLFSYLISASTRGRMNSIPGVAAVVPVPILSYFHTARGAAWVDPQGEDKLDTNLFLSKLVSPQNVVRKFKGQVMYRESAAVLSLNTRSLEILPSSISHVLLNPMAVEYGMNVKVSLDGDPIIWFEPLATGEDPRRPQENLPKRLSYAARIWASSDLDEVVQTDLLAATINAVQRYYVDDPNAKMKSSEFWSTRSGP